MTEENTNSPATGAEAPERIEIPWDIALPIIQALMQKNEVISQLGQLLVEAESKKDTIKDRILEANDILQNAVEKTRLDHEVPEGPEWELDLPEKEGEPAFFVKKN